MDKKALKAKLLEEIIADLDKEEGKKLKPKSEEIEITEVEPVEAMEQDNPVKGMPKKLRPEDGGEQGSMEPAEEDEEDDEDLKMLMRERMKG